MRVPSLIVKCPPNFRYVRNFWLTHIYLILSLNLCDVYLTASSITGLLLIAQFLGRFPRLHAMKPKRKPIGASDTGGRAFGVCGFFVFAIDVYAYI